MVRQEGKKGLKEGITPDVFIIREKRATMTTGVVPERGKLPTTQRYR